MPTPRTPQDLKDNFPYIVFSDHTFGFIQYLIKMWTKSGYNHVMLAVGRNVFASQGGTYSLVPFEKYMMKGNRLKFVEILGLSDFQRSIITDSVEEKLKRPWWKKIYDCVGIFGQLVHIKGVNIEGLNYCSEDVVYHIKKVLPYLKIEHLYLGIKGLPDHGSPEDLNYYMKQHQDCFKVALKWEEDGE